MKILIYIIFFLLILQVIVRLFRKAFHFPTPAFFGSILDSNYRRLIQPPTKIIRRSRITKGQIILEIGCGSGAFTTYAAYAVGHEGKVYALDIQPKMLAQLESKLKEPLYRELENIEIVEADAHSLPFTDNSFDCVYMVTTLYEIPDRIKVLKEVNRVLKPQGIVSINELFPDPDYPLPCTVKKDLAAAGFFDPEFKGNFWNYTITGKKR